MAKAAFKKFIGYYIGAIVLLLHLAGYIFFITDVLELPLEARDYVLFLAAVMGLSGVLLSQVMFNRRHIEAQERMDARQRADHQLEIQKQEKQHEHDWEREREAKQLEKKEEVVGLIFKNISHLNSIRDVFDDHVDFDTGEVILIISNRMILDIIKFKDNVIIGNALVALYFPNVEYEKCCEKIDNEVLEILTYVRLLQGAEESKDMIESTINKITNILQMLTFLKNSLLGLPSKYISILEIPASVQAPTPQEAA
ncbi:hypothetical protein [uncultured Shewanella sp.]|uniref:hypothetical protein n=1 Tax=uncultured Shewanella sp. TaxID=173975 RepID=UPI00261BB759|nr:hypothetical protein [uncultured Shewanella sp.]